MTYDDVAAVFLAPLVDPIDAPDVTATPARRLRDALEPIATQGWWSPQAGARLDALGIDFLAGYVWGRAAALGSPPASLVAATFGVFEPGLIAAVYEAGSALVSRDDILAARGDGATASVAAIADADECAAIADPLFAALDGLDGLGRPLFSALRSLPVPTSSGGPLVARRGTGSGTSRRRPPGGARRGRPHRSRSERPHRTVARLRPRRVQRHAGVRTGGTRRCGHEPASARLDGRRRSHRRGGSRHVSRSRRRPTPVRQSLIEACGADLDDIIARAADVSGRLVATRAFPADPRKRAGG